MDKINNLGKIYLRRVYHLPRNEIYEAFLLKEPYQLSSKDIIIHYIEGNYFAHLFKRQLA